MKKILSVILALTAILMITGCDDNTDTATKDEVPATIVNSNTATPDSVASDYQGINSVPKQNTDDATELINIDEHTTLISGFECLCQYPDLPTGCEITSLTMVLNHYGINADKCDLADNYLTKGEVGKVDYRSSFVGDPRDEYSYGCYCPVLVETANNYITTNGYNRSVISTEGTELEDLFAYINMGIPVVVWATLDCQEGFVSVTWEVDGKELPWITPEHCMVLVGYNDTSVIVADPVKGEIVSYDKDIFKARYDQLYKQSMIIK